MATSSVSALDQDTWQLVATNTTTSGTTSSFTGLTGYKKYMITYNNVSLTGSGSSYIQFNSDTGNNYFGGISLGNTDGTFQNQRDRIKLNYYAIVTIMNGYFIIENVNNGAPKLVTGQLNGRQNDDWHMLINGGWLTADTITSIVITAGGNDFSAGTIKLYGIAG
jgi:hypothetical protein